MRRLEDLEPGTTVFVGDTQVGEVRGIYAIGESQLAEYSNVAWSSRNEELLVPTSDVLAIEQRGVVLQGGLDSYDDLAALGAGSDPKIRRLH